MKVPKSSATRPFRRSTPKKGWETGTFIQEDKIGAPTFPVFHPSIEGGMPEHRNALGSPPEIDRAADSIRSGGYWSTSERASPLKCSEREVAASPEMLAHSLRLLARWLLSAARKGALVAHSSPVEGSQNHLDVGSEAKVGSESEAGEMPVQQAVQRDTR